MRFYHGWSHIQELYALLQEFVLELSHPVVVELAILFHDLVYVAGSSSNEEDSARAFEAMADKCTNLDTRERAAVVHLILGTKNHAAAGTNQGAVDANQQVLLEIGGEDFSADLLFFLDFDLAVLGWPTERYLHEYARGIYLEYRSVIPSLAYYCEKRADFLQRHFLDQGRIFKTADFLQHFEEQARRNIAVEIEQFLRKALVVSDDRPYFGGAEERGCF